MPELHRLIQLLAVLPNISPTRTGSPIHDLHEYLTSQTGGALQVLVKTPNKISIRRFQKYAVREFEL